MFSRHEQNKSATFFPKEWTDKLQLLLTSIYLSEIEKRDLEFLVHAFIYPNEVVLTVTLSDKENKKLPVTYFASCDVNEKEDPSKQLDIMSDSVGLFFDQYFSTDTWEDFLDLWTETKIKKLSFYYKVVRENIALSLEADRILSEDLKN